MDYYIGPRGRTATFTMRDFQNRHLAGAVGEALGDEPLTLEPRGPDGLPPYPSYEIITVDGVTEVIEHRQPEPMFYITDDQEVKRKLGVR